MVDAFNVIHLFVSFTSSLSHSLKSVIEVMHNFQLSAFMVFTVRCPFHDLLDHGELTPSKARVCLLWLAARLILTVQMQKVDQTKQHMHGEALFARSARLVDTQGLLLSLDN